MLLSNFSSSFLPVTSTNQQTNSEYLQSSAYNNTTIFQTNDDDDLKNQYIVEFYAFPFIVIVGTICNILTFMVMRRKRMRNQSTYFYMAVLAIADEMVLINGCLNFWIYLYTKQNILILTIFSCKLASFAFYATLHFSVWLVVVMTIERFIAVALPLKANSLCTVKRAKTVTITLALLIIVINFHFLFTHSLSKSGESYGCMPITENYEFFMEKIWPWIDASIYSFIPLSILIVFNILIVYNLIKASKSIQKLNNSTYSNNKNVSQNKSNKKNKRDSKSLDCDRSVVLLNLEDSTIKSSESKQLINQKTNRKTTRTSQPSVNNSSSTANNSSRKLTIMLLVVSMTFFATSVPIVALQTIEKANLITNGILLDIVRGIFLTLQYLNHSINFFLYAVTGQTFRREFFDLFRFGKKSTIHKSKTISHVNTMRKRTSNT
jgi:hypothetical protein